MGPNDPIFAEKRIMASFPGIERPGANMLQVYGLSDIPLPSVTIETGLTVPAVWAAVNFLSRTLAALPLHAFRKTESGQERIKGGLETLIHEAPNGEWTSFKLRQWFWQQVFTGGRGLLYIERSGSNIVSLWPFTNPSRVEIKRSPTGRTVYSIDGQSYSSSEVIDIPFMLKSDGVCHYGPITQNAGVIQLALSMNQYGSSFFAGGGVPPLALEGPVPAGAEAMKRMMADVSRVIDQAKSEQKPLFPMPPGYTLKPVGFEPDKGQMTEAQRFQVEQIARIYSLPPVFLQDLTHGTFSNSEQQDLFFVKHLVGQWAEALDQELNLKLFGQRNGGRFVEHNLDGLLRGDFKSRMEAHASSVQNAVRTPNEVRALEGLPALPKGNDLMIQGATVPLGTQPTDTGTPPPDDGGKE